MLFAETNQVYIIGVELERENICKNPGKRTISKLMLNSLWGKFAQRPNQVQTEILTEYQQYLKLVTDSKIKIKGISIHLNN